jgi:hypothetical protein
VATKRDIALDQGSAKTLVFTVYNNAVSVSNLANLTGYSAKFWIAKSLSSTAEIKIDGSNGITIGGVLGTVTVVISHTITSALKFIGDKYTGVYQLEVTDAAGKIYRVVEGVCTINKEIIKP